MFIRLATGITAPYLFELCTLREKKTREREMISLVSISCLNHLERLKLPLKWVIIIENKESKLAEITF